MDQVKRSQVIHVPNYIRGDKDCSICDTELTRTISKTSDQCYECNQDDRPFNLYRKNKGDCTCKDAVPYDILVLTCANCLNKPEPQEERVVEVPYYIKVIAERLNVPKTKTDICNKISNLLSTGEINDIKDIVKTIEVFDDKEDRSLLSNGFIAACHNGHLNVVKFLLEQRCTLISAGEHGSRQYTLNFGLREASYKGYLDIVRIVIAHGGDNYNKVLWGGCESSNIEIVRLSIDNSIMLNKALEIACSKDDLEIVKLICSKKKLSGTKDIFLNACREKKIEMVKYMMSVINYTENTLAQGLKTIIGTPEMITHYNEFTRVRRHADYLKQLARLNEKKEPVTE